MALVSLADETGSPFDVRYLQGLKRTQFMRGLTERLSKPVMPSDEPFDYLPTQAVADFLAMEPSPGLDGIIYPSVQAGGFDRLTNPGYRVFRRPLVHDCNVVLFHKAARVQALEEVAELYVPSDHDYLGLELLPKEGSEYIVWTEPPRESETHADDAPLKFKSLTAHRIRSVSIEVEDIKTARWLKEQAKE
jgi:RES domain